MEVYGSYETSRELASGPGSAVFAAVKTGGDASAKFAVKVVFPGGDDVFGAAATSGPDPAQAFLSSIAIQQRAAAASPRILPIVESGHDARGSWSVTALQPRSIQSLVAGRVALPQASLLHVLRGVVGGLLDLKRVCGRSHGRLGAGNVLISGGATMGEAQVLLTDPAPEGIDPAACELADLRAVGLLLFQLVRRREVQDDADWLILPLESTKEWTTTFGRATAAWLELGNALLDRNLSLERYNLQKLSDTLAGLEPKPPVSRRTLIIAAAAAVLVVVGVVLLVRAGSWVTIQVAVVGPAGVDGPPDARLTVDGVVTKPAAGEGAPTPSQTAQGSLV